MPTSSRKKLLFIFLTCLDFSCACDVVRMTVGVDGKDEVEAKLGNDRQVALHQLQHGVDQYGLRARFAAQKIRDLQFARLHIQLTDFKTNALVATQLAETKLAISLVGNMHERRKDMRMSSNNPGTADGCLESVCRRGTNSRP
eukprot:scaffold180070_cov19-Prasinocladus_malaysianus.AAC.1